MDIDIIELTDEDYNDLSSVQLAMIYTAQTEKNNILLNAANEKIDRLNALLKQNMARSTLREDVEKQIDEDAKVKIEAVKEDLLYRLTYDKSNADGNERGKYSYPENPNYDLSYEQRFLVVRDYYMRYTKDANLRLSLFGNDVLAAEYLGEFYQTLYELFLYYTK